MAAQRDNKISQIGKERYVCPVCRKEYADLQNGFYTIHSKLSRAGSDYSVVCKNCVDGEFKRALDVHSDRKAAVKYACSLLGVLFNEDIFDALPKTNAALSTYINRLYNVAPTQSTYLDTIIDDLHEDDTEMRSDYAITETDIEQFGNTWEPDEHRAMRRMYNKLSDKHELTYSEELDLIAACKSLALAERALRSGDSATYIKLNDLYSKTVDRFQERFKKQSAANENDTSTLLGEKIRMIEQYTPAEYYKDQSLFSEGKEYIERFILRPLKNMITGNYEEDGEYHV